MAQLDNTLSRLKRFTAEAAHQIRTPLAGLNSQAQNAIDETDEVLRQKQLQHILESSNVLADTVNQLLNRATLTHRYQSHPFSPVSLDHVIKETCRELVVWALERQVEIEYVGDIQVTINGDEFALKQMLQNIIENAIKYSPKGGTVEVALMLTNELVWKRPSCCRFVIKVWGCRIRTKNIFSSIFIAVQITLLQVLGLVYQLLRTSQSTMTPGSI